MPTTTLITPRALLLDFGGVIATTDSVPGWEQEIATKVANMLIDAHLTPPGMPRILADLQAGRAADHSWKNAMSRHRAPKELTYEEFWTEFVACDWDEDARAVLGEHAAELCLLMGRARQQRTLRPGMVELLDFCVDQGIPVAIASNALCGEVHREFLIAHDLSDRFVAECYSDELGVRKPNPALLQAAADHCGVAIGECWYVGDTVDRDIVAGKRAGIGAGITMKVPGDPQPLYPMLTWFDADATVADPHELLELLRDCVGNIRL